jgi:hypothetical protein
MSKLASLYETYKQWREAEGKYARLCGTERKNLGDRDPETSVVEIMHGRMIAKQGRGRAEDVHRVVHEVERRAQPVLGEFCEIDCHEGSAGGCE